MADKELIIRINGDIKGYREALKATQKQTEDLQRTLTNTAKIGAVAFAGFGGAIALTVSKAAKFETIDTQFQVLTGSVEKARTAVKDLSDFSATTPFQFEDIARAGKQLLGFQFTVEELKPTLQAIGDIAAATGANFSDLTLVFGQVKAAGKLTGERLLQLQERAVPIGPALAQTMGVTEKSIKDLVGKGKIDFKTFEKAFKSISQEGGMAFGGMAKNAETLEGKMSTLKDNFNLVSADIGKYFLPMLKTLAGAAINFLQFLREHEGLTAFISKLLIAGTVTSGLVTTVSLLGIVFIKLRAALIASSIATKGLSFAVKGLIGSTGLGLLVAFLPEILTIFKHTFYGIKAIVQNIGGSIAKAIGGIGSILRGIFSFDLGMIKEGLSDFKSAFSQIAEESGKQIKATYGKYKEEEEKQTEIVKTEAGKRYDIKKLNAEKEAILQAELAALSKEQRDLLTEEDIQALRNKIQTDGEIKAEYVKKTIENKRAEHAQLIKDEMKYGKTLAKFKAFMRTDEINNADIASRELVKLQNSKNAQLKAIGKAAALVQIGIDTSRGAIAAYQAMAGIPIVGPGLGIAAAAALTAYGFERAAEVAKAQEGGIVGGSGFGDKMPFLLEPGELITPRQNFEEVINAVVAQRQAQGQTSTATENEGSYNEVLIGFDGQEAADVLTVRQNEQNYFGISQNI